MVLYVLPHLNLVLSRFTALPTLKVRSHGALSDTDSISDKKIWVEYPFLAMPAITKSSV